MEKSIDDKIRELTPDEKIDYHQDLIGILECKAECIFYGAKDPVNLPPSDVNIVKINLYNQMFESGKYKTY